MRMPPENRRRRNGRKGTEVPLHKPGESRHLEEGANPRRKPKGRVCKEGRRQSLRNHNRHRQARLLRMDGTPRRPTRNLQRQRNDTPPGKDENHPRYDNPVHRGKAEEGAHPRPPEANLLGIGESREPEAMPAVPGFSCIRQETDSPVSRKRLRHFRVFHS